MARPRKPIADHIRDKTYRADRHASRLGVVRSNGQLTTEPPPDLDDIAADMWVQLTTTMPEYLDSLDGHNLSGMCRWYSAWCRTMDLADKQGPERNYKAIQQAAVCWKQFASLAGEFGLSRSSREKLGLVWVPPDEEDPLAEFGITG